MAKENTCKLHIDLFLTGVIRIRRILSWVLQICRSGSVITKFVKTHINLVTGSEHRGERVRSWTGMKPSLRRILDAFLAAAAEDLAAKAPVTDVNRANETTPVDLSKVAGGEAETAAMDVRVMLDTNVAIVSVAAVTAAGNDTVIGETTENDMSAAKTTADPWVASEITAVIDKLAPVTSARDENVVNETAVDSVDSSANLVGDETAVVVMEVEEICLPPDLFCVCLGEPDLGLHAADIPCGRCEQVTTGRYGRHHRGHFPKAFVFCLFGEPRRAGTFGSKILSCQIRISVHC
jgi:hypothetical protein